jgi:hypothetical protein
VATGALDVVDGFVEPFGVIFSVAEQVVALEAEETTNATGGVVVVDV